MILTEYRDAVGAHDIGQGIHDRLGEGVGFRVLQAMGSRTVEADFFIMHADEVGQHFRVCGAVEDVSLGTQLFPQGFKVLDDAVVDKGDPS